MDIIFGFDLDEGNSVSSYVTVDGKRFSFLDSRFSIGLNISHYTVYYKAKDGGCSFNKNADFSEIYVNFWKQPSILNENDFKNFSKSIIEYFNLCYEKDFFPVIDSKTKNNPVKKIVFCIGYPAIWSEKDAELYESIIKQTSFGYPEITVNSKNIKLILLLEKESRAAMLHYQNTLPDYTQNKNRLLINIDSSITDITAVLGKNNTAVYNSGNSNLGAGIIDYLLLDYLLSEKLQEKHPDLIDYYSNNSKALTSLLISVRVVKDKLFDDIKNGLATYAYIDNSEIINNPIQVTSDDLQKTLELPVSKVLSKYNVNNILSNSDAERNWKDLFVAFLERTKKELDKRDFIVEEIIFTGNAALMYFIPDLCKQVFNNKSVSIQYDKSPGDAIANGLVLCAITNAKSMMFKKEAEDEVTNEIPVLVSKNIQSFADIISSGVASYVSRATFLELCDWKNGRIKTLNEIKEKLASKCESSQIIYFISRGETSEQLKVWYSRIYTLLSDEINQIAKKYNVNYESASSNNFLPDLKIISPIQDITSELISTIISKTFDMTFSSETSLSGAIFSFALQAIVECIMIVADLGVLFISILLLPFGIDLKAPSNVVYDKIRNINIPLKIRQVIKTEDLQKASDAGNEEIKNQIEKIINDENFKKDMTNRISNTLTEELNVSIKRIQYIIESQN